VTTNNDTPRLSGEDAPDEAALAEAAEAEAVAGDEAEPYISPGPNPFSSVYPQGSGPFPQRERQAANGWGRWDSPEEAGAAANGYPRPSFRPAEPGYPRVPGYAQAPGEQAIPGYLPGPGYPPGSGHAHRRYAQGPASGYAPGSEYAPDPGYRHEAAPLPPLEPLPDPGTDGPPWAARAAQGWPGQLRDNRLPAPAPAEDEAGAPRPTSESLTSELLLHGKRVAPGTGWRKGIYRVTGGLLRFGESAAEMRRRDLINRVRTPVAGGHHRIAVLSLKGGVGKTTTAVGLGATLATLRGDRVIAVDANPDRGTLSDKVRLETAATVRDLLNERDQIRRYADVRAFTSQAPSRLEVLASDRDPGVSVAFGADDY
jgi:hypothetical protein